MNNRYDEDACDARLDEQKHERRARRSDRHGAWYLAEMKRLIATHHCDYSAETCPCDLAHKIRSHAHHCGIDAHDLALYELTADDLGRMK